LQMTYKFYVNHAALLIIADNGDATLGYNNIQLRETKGLEEVM
jgi:hypothetical protein